MNTAAAAVAAVAVLVAGCSGGDPGSRDGCCATSSTSGTGATSSTSGGAGSSTSGDPGSRDGCCATSSTSGDASGGEPGLPLAGRVVVLDPGHQLGNARFPDEVGRPVDAGGFEKECNTTGTSTDDGYPESTFVWEVAQEATRMLRRLGARVVLTRESDSADRWGPCVDERGRAGNPGTPGPTADVKVSIHADGVREAGARGFHVIRPGRLRGWTDDVAAESGRLARALRNALVRAGLAPSSYRGRRGIDVRTDLGTLNLSDVPVVLAELGNMRDPRDAARMRSERGRERYARAIVRGVRAHLSG